MKRILLVALLLVASTSNALSLNGSEGVGGGDEVGAEFKAVAERAFQFLPALSNKEAQGRVDAALKNAKIIVVDRSLDLRIEDQIQISAAVNDPAKGIIYVSRKRWLDIKDDVMKQIIAAHEIYSLAYVEKSGDYTFSSFLKAEDAFKDYAVLSQFLKGFMSWGEGSDGICRLGFLLVPGMTADGFDRLSDVLRVKLDMNYSLQNGKFFSSLDSEMKLIAAGSEMLLLNESEGGRTVVKMTKESPNSLIIEARSYDFAIGAIPSGTCRLKTRKQ
jgi:hypothetical protein